MKIISLIFALVALAMLTLFWSTGKVDDAGFFGTVALFFAILAAGK